MAGVDWAGLALVSRLEQWLADHPHRFVVSMARLVRPGRGSSTTIVPVIRSRDALLDGPARPEAQRERTGAFRLATGESVGPKERLRPLVLPVKKVQATFPSMITFGRTDNNDIVLPDEQISKFHAFFRLVDDGVQLFDAGSRNGTFVGGHRLQPRAAGVRIPDGGRFSLGAIELQLLDARAVWHWIRQIDRFA